MRVKLNERETGQNKFSKPVTAIKAFHKYFRGRSAPSYLRVNKEGHDLNLDEGFTLDYYDIKETYKLISDQ